MDSYEFEELLVGSMLAIGDHVHSREIAAKLPPEAIENFHLRKMYEVIVSLLGKTEAIDPFTVRDGVPEGTKAFVLEVSKRASMANNIRVWAKRVRQCWMVRKGLTDLKVAMSLLESASPDNLNERLAEVSGTLAKIQFETNEKLPRRVADMIPDYLNVLDKRMAGATSGLYLRTGIEPMDEKYGGFDRTDLIIIAGRPGMGKTELAINIANSIGRDKGRGLIISLEMSDLQVVERHIADRSGIPIGVLRQPLNMQEEEYAMLTAATGTLLDEENYVLSGSFNVDEIIAHAERMVMDTGLGFLAIDYLGLIPKPKAERPDLAIAEITRKLKQFCLRNKVPVILLSQLNRGLESRGEKRPNMADLRESGAIEQDADVIIFPYRDEVYNENSNMRGIAEIIIGKYRSGKPQTFYMGWRNGHFKNIDQQEAARRFAENENHHSGKTDWR
ncbi:replicative DNA helicase [Martelella alba]|uniref:DNA 5'-3' helicase n=1 Tax=Martelella alba TaxID=2590451 RepID=A0ABY2SI95_9HYPH|nr:replicative DNA helicase [Martelella alba]TKI03555.1 DNA helicase [Martelella alba]